MPRIAFRQWSAAFLSGTILAAVFLAACGGDGRPSDRLLIARNDGLVELSLATQQERLLILSESETLPAEPAVSPDGRQIVYTLLLLPIVRPGEATDFGADLTWRAVTERTRTSSWSTSSGTSSSARLRGSPTANASSSASSASWARE
ncbi:MAG: hypothetical protein IIC73_03850 [Armatimonadetes bacterium]|nr:hypothetical protein [Armatimonadota bacterium]